MFEYLLFQPFDGSFAVCPNCGTMSKDYNNCDYCKKEMPLDCRRYDPVKKKEEEARKRKERQKRLETERLLIAKLVCVTLVTSTSS